jgi:hypothetical protein
MNDPKDLTGKTFDVTYRLNGGVVLAYGKGTVESVWQHPEGLVTLWIGLDRVHRGNQFVALTVLSVDPVENGYDLPHTSNTHTPSMLELRNLP